MLQKIFGLLLAALVVFSCNQKLQLIDGNEICNLASPVNLTSDTTLFYLSDYFTDVSLVDTIIFPSALSTEKINDSLYRLVKTDSLPLISIIRVLTTNAHYEILAKNYKTEKVAVHLPDKKYEKVAVRGNLNFWNVQNSTMHKTDSGWVELFDLPPGEYQYLLVVDGTEQPDFTNPDSIDNNMGGFNSLLKVGNYIQDSLPFIRSAADENDLVYFQSNSLLTKVVAFWQNNLAASNTEVYGLAVPIPKAAKELKRSFIRVIGYNDRGFSNDLLIPLEYGEVIYDPEKLTRNDRETMMMYFMMVDRFKNGNPANDEKVNDPGILPKANYFGGDLAGINQALKDGYFKKLGVNTIWLSPILQNPREAYGLFPDPKTEFSGYHGYWPISSTKIDYRFGTSADLREIIDRSHQKNMNVFLDYVANHVHELHPVYQQHPDWATSLYLPDGSLNTEKWDEYRLTTWFDTFLPTLDLRKPKVVEPMTDSALYWFENYDIDGFRHDATKHIDELYWRTLTRKIKLETNCDPMPYQIGETYGSPELIASYIGSGMLDAQFDFNVYDNAVAVFARSEEPFKRLQATLNESLRYYGYHNLMGNITGNQDRPRFISLAGGDLSFTEDAKYAGWTRNIGVGDSSSYKKLALLHAFNMTIPGIPTIYYGDEIGLPGANDPDNRRMMKFDNLNNKETELRSTVTKLAALRRGNMSLLYGDIRFLELSSNTWVFVRTYFDQAAFVIFNKANEEKTIRFQHDMVGDNLKAEFGNNVSISANTAEITLPPYSFEILTTK